MFHTDLFMSSFLRRFIFLFAFMVASSHAVAQSQAPVMLDGDTLFVIHTSLGAFTPEKRANEVNAKLQQLLEDDTAVYDSIKLTNSTDFLTITLYGNVIVSVTHADAQVADTTPIVLAETYRSILIDKLTQVREIYSHKSLTSRFIKSGAYLIAAIILLWIITWASRYLRTKILTLLAGSHSVFSFRGKEIISRNSIIRFLLLLVRGLQLAASLFILYFSLSNSLTTIPYTRKWDLEPYIKVVTLLLFYTVSFIALFRGIGTLNRLINNRYKRWLDDTKKRFGLESSQFLSAERTVSIVTFVKRSLSLFMGVILTYSYAAVVFSLFSFSSTWAAQLLYFILSPLSVVWKSFVTFLPNLFFIIVLSVVFYYLTRLVKVVFKEVERGTIELPGFYQDWSMPTYNIVRLMIIVLAAIVIFPYLPGSNSPFFQGISVFIGILFSLGSSSATTNMVAGVVLTYMRPFVIGDRVKIADTVGDVLEKTLLVTRIKTIKNVDVTIPNAMVLGSHIINYSSSANNPGIILNTSVTIGYDVPWRTVHQLLVSAAESTSDVLKEPRPFVLQTALNDFYVAYEINCYTNKSSGMAVIYSELHSKIQDAFNEAGVEIMSPHYSAVRDGNQTTVPEENLPKDYKAPGFRLFGINFPNTNGKPE